MMSYVQQSEKLKYLYELICKGNCGGAPCLAERMHVSVRTLKTYISVLRELGYSIQFDSLTKTYFVANKDCQIEGFNPIHGPILKMG